MAPVIALFIITIVSLIAVRVGGKALMMTGLSWDTASFQAYSAFFGVGFTTKEAEMVVNHPVRRRIIRDLILAGNIGLTSALATLVVTVMESNKLDRPMLVIGSLIAGLAGIFLLFRIGVLQRLLDHAIQRTLEKAGMVHALDYELLLRIRAGMCVSEIEILPGTYLAERKLKHSRPADHGVLVLAISCEGRTLVSVPDAHAVVHAGDVVTAYGHESDLKKLLLSPEEVVKKPG
jgi:hypothetical protein